MEVFTIFLHNVNRSKSLLEPDGKAIAYSINSAKKHDRVDVIRTDTCKTVVSFQAVSRSGIELKMFKGKAIAQLKKYLLNLSNNPPENAQNNLAKSLMVAFDRFNSVDADINKLVLLNDGLHEDKSMSWIGCYPSHSFISNPDSPFFYIKPITGKSKNYVVMLPDENHFVDQFHAGKIIEFYKALFHVKNVRYFAFTYDHETAMRLLMDTSKIQSIRPPDSSDMQGQLILTNVEGLKTE